MPKLLVVGFCIGVLLFVQAMSQSCNKESLTNEEIEYLSSNCTTSSCSKNNPKGITYFFPHLTFTCNGSLVNWTISGNISYGDIETNPTLIIWRLSTTNAQKYKIQRMTPLIYCNGNRMVPTSPQVYKCELHNGLLVREGDILGMELPYFHSNADMLIPYFDQNSDDLPRINFIRGTAILSFVPSSSNSVKSLPLLSVGVVPAGPSSDTNTAASASTSTRATSGAPSTLGTNTNDTKQANGRTIMLGLREKVGIAAGAFFLLVIFTLLVSIQCCVIVRNRNKRQRRLSRGARDSVYSTQPYAVVSMRGMDLSKMKIRSFGRRVDNIPISNIPISNNPSYATIVTASDSDTRCGNGDSMYVSSEDIRIRDGSCTLEEMERYKASKQGLGNNASELLPVGTEYDSHSVQVLVSTVSKEENNTLAQDHRRPDEADSGIYQQDTATSGSRELDEDEDEHIYY